MKYVPWLAVIRLAGACQQSAPPPTVESETDKLFDLILTGERPGEWIKAPARPEGG